MEEMLDVVDARNEVVRQAPRSVVLKDGLLHRSAHLFVFDRNGNLFVHRRAENKEEYPGLWDGSAAGHLSAGEDSRTCIIREAEEELGLANIYPVFLREFAARKVTCHEFVAFFRTEGVRRRDVIFDPVEMTDGKWLALKEVVADMKRVKYSPTFRLMLEWYLETFGG